MSRFVHAEGEILRSKASILILVEYRVFIIIFSSRLPFTNRSSIFRISTHLPIIPSMCMFCRRAASKQDIIQIAMLLVNILTDAKNNAFSGDNTEERV